MLQLRNRVAVFVTLLALTAPSVAGVCEPGVNLADIDGNGSNDYACVGDWNGNGICEMQADLQTAILNLTDAGPKTVLLDDCSFEPPVTAYSTHGIVVLSDNTTLVGSGPGTVLHGFVETDVQSPQAVITNSDHLRGNSNIVIRDLRIDGGWRGGDASEFGHARMGVRFTNCQDCTVERVEVTDTLHACLYTSNSINVQFRDSTLKRCGNYTGQGYHFPCVYIYSYAGGWTQNTMVSGIDCDGSGAAAFSTRRDSPSSRLLNLTFQNNTGRNTAYYPDGAHRPCFNLSGVGSAQYLNNTCIETGGLTSLATETYYSEGQDVNASANTIVDGLHVVSSTVNPPIRIARHSENFTLRNVTVEGVSGGHCMEFETPLRNFSLDGAQLSDCGELGIHHNSTEPSGDAEDEALTFRNVEIVSAGTDLPSEGIRFRARMKGLTLRNVSVTGATASGLAFTRDLEESTITGVTVANVAGDGIHLGGNTRNVSVTDADIDGTGGSCIFLGGTPWPAMSHEQMSITESSLANCGDRGIGTAIYGLAVREFRISDNHIDGVDGDGIEIALAGSSNENVDVEHNTLRNFGRSMAAETYGIELQGSLTGTMISQNVLYDENDQATFGIYHRVPGSHPTYLCSNPCVGTLLPSECLHDFIDPSYQTDSDLDGTVDACEDDDGDGVYGPDDNCATLDNPQQADADQDGVGDLCDNCITEHNTLQGDLDGDAEGDHCDLDDDLVYLLFADTRSLSWQLEQGFERWNVYRGDLALLPAGGSYTQQPGSNPLAGRTCDLGLASLEDADPLAPGQVAFYLVSGAAGLVRETVGWDSTGRLRPNAHPCPES